jgi:hypothetical protein
VSATAAKKREIEEMITYQRVLDYVRAEPFRPFRIHMASGRTFDIRHPEFDSVSLMLIESISHLEAPVH